MEDIGGTPSLAADTSPFARVGSFNHRGEMSGACCVRYRAQEPFREVSVCTIKIISKGGRA